MQISSPWHITARKWVEEDSLRGSYRTGTGTGTGDRGLHQHLCNLLIIVAVVCLCNHLSCIVVVYHTIEEITKKFVKKYINRLLELYD